MKQFLSLLKATTQGDMSVFKIKTKGKGIGKYIGLAAMSLLFMFCIYTYADMFGEPLHEVGLTYVLLTLFSFALVILNIMEGVYKSQGILFDAKDNNLLFSLPIKKSYILASRIIKLLAFDYIFEILMMIPCILKYAIYETPGILFYLITIIFLILLPFIPVVIACIVGYLIKLLSSKTKFKKLAQTLLSLVLLILLMGVSFSLQSFVSNIASKAQSINDMLNKIYLPIGLYIDLIQKFDILKLIELVLISIVPFILFIYIFQFKYDSIINKSKETGLKHNKTKKTIIQTSTKIKALTKKELKTYFSIPTYIVNTMFGPIMALLAAIVLCVKGDSIMASLLAEDSGMTEEMVTNMIPFIIMGILLFLSAMTSITSSSISLEGKKLPLLKSLPINPKDIFKSKIIMSDIIVIPPMLISAIVMIIKFKVFNINTLFIILVATLIPHFSALVGLLLNLLFPKLDYNTEVEVIKQSLSVFISSMFGLVMCILPIIIFAFMSDFIGTIPVTIILFVISFIACIIITHIINTYGTRRFQEL